MWMIVKFDFINHVNYDVNSLPHHHGEFWQADFCTKRLHQGQMECRSQL